MIKKLRKRFILLALAVVAAVILVVVVGIDVANYLDMRLDADKTIAFLEKQGAEPPLAPPTGDGAPIGTPQGDPGENRQGQKPKNLPGETAFAARYFTVETDRDGVVTGSDLGRIAFVSEEDVSTFVSRATKERGFVGNYRYLATATEDGGTHYLFLDCEKELASTRTFILSSAIITAIGLALIATLIIVLSGKLLAPVEESYQKQKRFITDAGHELKTPLTVIGANAELLEMELGEENEWLTSIKRQTQKLGNLTKQLVYLSRMDEAAAPPEKAPFDLAAATEACADGFREAALVAKKRILTDLEPLRADANEEMIRRAINLILDNAIKYAEGEEILLTLRKEGKRAILEQSNAASLEKGAHPELFERFYRPDVSRNGETGGHGIGLAVVKSILEANGGEATCDADGERITFRLSIPLA